MQQFSVKTEPIKVTIKTRMERGYKMQLQKLSANVSKRANKTVRRIIMGLCALASLAILGVILFYTVRNNSERVQLYSSQIDSKMSQKAALRRELRLAQMQGIIIHMWIRWQDCMMMCPQFTSA